MVVHFGRDAGIVDPNFCFFRDSSFGGRPVGFFCGEFGMLLGAVCLKNSRIPLTRNLFKSDLNGEFTYCLQGFTLTESWIVQKIVYVG